MSEEYEAASAGLPVEIATRHRRILKALIKQYGRPDLGSTQRVSVVVSTLDNSYTQRSPLNMERYVWCPPNQENLPSGCPLTIVLMFNPVLGVGKILFAKPELLEFEEVFQRSYPQPDVLYTQLHNVFQYRSGTSERLGPSNVDSDTHMTGAGKLSSDTEELGRDPPVLATDHEMDESAERSGIARIAPSHGLSSHDDWLESNEIRAHILEQNSWPEDIYYWMGRDRGLEDRYYLWRYGGAEEHARWMNAINSSDPMIRAFGRGYRDSACVSSGTKPPSNNPGGSVASNANDVPPHVDGC
jgi:hypothetical protein